MPPKRRRAAARLGNNLNAELPPRPPLAVGRVRAWFQPEHIVAHLRRKILSAHYVVACVAWCSNPVLLDALRRCRGVSLVINYDRGLIRKHREEYMALTPMEGARTAVSWVRGRGRALMHHKFAVYLDASKRPLSVTTGSFNWTKQSTKNVEHILEVCDPVVAARFMREHLDVLAISTPLPKPRKPRTPRAKRTSR